METLWNPGRSSWIDATSKSYMDWERSTEYWDTYATETAKQSRGNHRILFCPMFRRIPGEMTKGSPKAIHERMLEEFLKNHLSYLRLRRGENPERNS